VFWATGNAVLAANAAAFASYPAAAIAAQLLFVTMGAGLGAAWVGGLLFALGPLRVPASLQILQYANLFLPLVAWSLVRLRGEPTRARAVLLFVVIALGALSSYHLAAMIGVVGAVWGVLELARPLPRRLRFVACAAAAGAAAVAVVAVVSIPYFLRPEAHDAVLLGTQGGIRQPSPVRDTVKWFALLAPLLFGAPALVLAAAGLPALLARRAPVARRLAVSGASLVLVGAVLMLPPEPVRALIDGSPLRFLRAPWRFVAVAGLGTALLATALLEWLCRRWSPLASRIAVAAAAALAIAHGVRLVENGVDPVAPLAFDRAVYEAVGRVAAVQGGGPLLELPERDAAGEGVRSDIPRALVDPDAMVGVTLHGQPLVTGRTGYPPPHRRMLDVMIARLPAREALQELVDATHLRWLLLRPEGFWADDRRRRGLLATAGVTPVLERDGWVLARVDLTPSREDWYATISEPANAARSPFGVPLAPLDPATAAAEVSLRTPPRSPRARTIVWVDSEVRNAGADPWPVTGYVGTRLGVFLAAQWHPVSGPPAAPFSQVLALPRDLAPGETARQRLPLKVPREPGVYELELLVKQWNGSRFESPANRPFRGRVEVVAQGAAPPRAGGAAVGEGNERPAPG
jgi:hypothetical protein